MNLFFIVLAFGFVFLNAFFVAAEFAMVKLRESRVQSIKENYGLRGRVLFQVHKNLDIYLSACQLGITLASLGLGWVGEPAFAHILEPLFKLMSIQSSELIKLFSFGVAFSIISFLHIVVGELMPKSIAIRQSEKLSLYTAIPLYIFYWTMYPFIWILNYTSSILLKLFRLDVVHHGEQAYSRDEIKFILKSSHVHSESNDELNHKYKSMMIRMLEFIDLEAVDVMRPLEEMVSINQDAELQDKIDIIKKFKYTRYPVYQKNIHHIIGILHVKDMFLENQEDAVVALRKVVKVHRHTKAIEILEQFRHGMPNFALVYYHQKPIGFITLDNLLHVVIGKMRDEFNLTQEDWHKLPDGSFMIKGSSPVYNIEKLLNINLTAYHADTAAGLLLNNLGHIPSVGEEWQHSAFVLRAQKVQGHRIIEINLIPR